MVISSKGFYTTQCRPVFFYESVSTNPNRSPCCPVEWNDELNSRIQAAILLRSCGISIAERLSEWVHVGVGVGRVHGEPIAVVRCINDQPQMT
jgi:hypothetical protein